MMKRKSLTLIPWLITVLMLLGLVSCLSFTEVDGRKPDELIVFAAASLSDSFTELEGAFEQAHPGVNLVMNFASSSQLAAQLREGVRADVFASANENQMQIAVASGRVDSAEVRLFAANMLTIVVPTGNPADIQTLEDLGNADVSLLMAVEGVPVRGYADQIISALPESTQAKIYANLVSEESNVRQVSTKIALGEADAGIVYASDITPDIVELVENIRIPDSLNVVAAYPIAMIKDSQTKDFAKSFIDFLLSEIGQNVLANWGFLPIQTEIAY